MSYKTAGLRRLLQMNGVSLDGKDNICKETEKICSLDKSALIMEMVSFEMFFFLNNSAGELYVPLSSFEGYLGFF